MEMVVVKQVRLTKKDAKGLFEKGSSNEGQIVIRTKAVISMDSVKESEASYQETGLLYIVDKKATEERNAIVEAEVEAARQNGAKGIETVAEVVTSEFGEDGFDKEGYNKDGFDKDGFNKDGFNAEGFDAKGFDKEGYNKDGFDSKGKKKQTL